MVRKPRKPGTTMSSVRTEAYSDGVFAIAATLLVLDLTTHSIGKITSDQQMWAALGNMWPSLMSFVISFVLLSMLWVIHLDQFRDIARVDGVLLWLNNARLLFIVLIPFTTSLTADYSQWYAGRMLLPVNFFFAALTGMLSYSWAAAREGHLLHDGGLEDAREQRLGGVAAVICGAIAVAFSPWFGSWAFLAYALNGPVTTLLVRRHRAKRAAAAAASGT